MFKKILYTLCLVIFAVFSFFILKNANLKYFIDTVENRTFDLRQSILINQGVKKPSEDIVIVAIDDATYEYILDNYGEWPLPRDIYAKIVNYLEQQSPRSVVFDLMFVKSLKSVNAADLALIDTFKKYNNLYTSMNFDNQSEDLRTPPQLPSKLTFNITNNSKINFFDLTYINCRKILQGIIDTTSNIGIINVSRSDDGILRKMPVVVKYQNAFYPQLALRVGLDYLGETQNSFEIDKHSDFVISPERKIFLDKDGSAILNWYGPAGTYTYIPMYKLIKAVNGEKTELEYDFSNKIIYFGTTASSLFDIKTVPTGKIFPGVEVQATYLNNIIDNNFIKKVESFNERRSSYYSEVASNLFTETVEDSYDDWILILDKYTESVDAVNDSSSFLKENCVNKHYSNSDIMNKCDAFIIAYETVINYYTKDILSFNDVIEEFRREKDLNDNDTNFKNYVSKYQYVDINSDGEFIGKSSN